MSAPKSYWWENDPEERFWMEAVARPEFGTRLLAPYDRGRDGTDMPFHASVDMVRDGDVILHWATGPHHTLQGLVGYSIVNGLPFQTEAVRYEAADPLPGRAALLRGFTEFPEPLTREALHEQRQKIFDLKTSLTEAIHARRHAWKQSLLFPFDPYGRGREIRVHQGAYLSKFPAALFDVLPELLPARNHPEVNGHFVVTAESADRAVVETRLDRRRARESGDLGDASVRRAVEAQALRQARAHLESDGSHVTDVGPSRSFDLLLSPVSGGADRQVIVRGSTERVRALDVSSEAVDDIHRSPTDLVLVHDVPCKRDGSEVLTSDGELDVRRGWQPTISTLVPTQYRHMLE